MSSLLLTLLTASMPSADPIQYRFVPDTQRLVGFIRGNRLYLGRLDEKGEFLQEQQYKPAGLDGVFKYSGPGFDDLTVSPKYPAAAFEFRSGMLVPGELRDTGHFVPNEGGKVIKFTDYRYTPDAPRIWNLPGRFELVKTPRDKK